jgi:signal peptidase I
MSDQPESTSEASKTSSGGISDTIQSLIVAFVLAMTARGFVLEGFVIPTGSMAPTLMGEHVRWKSPQTGWSYAVDAGTYIQVWTRFAKIMATANNQMSGASPEQRQRIGVEAARRSLIARWDPMFGLDRPVDRSRPDLSKGVPARAGDRVLVLKTLYPIFGPDRFDVVVFKNPTDPVGGTQNFIKRLVGLPEEQLVTVDGDIFTGPLDAASDQLRIVRKPESIQRAVWQPVYGSNYEPIDLDKWRKNERVAWWGAPWAPEAGDDDWTIGTDRAWRSSATGPTSLRFKASKWPITDFNMYNVYRGGDVTISPLLRRPYAVSDVRVAGSIAPDKSSDFKSTTLEMESRGIRFQWTVAVDSVSLLMTDVSDGRELASASEPFSFPGRAITVDFWQVDQQMWLFVDGALLLQLPFDDWSPVQRFNASFPGTSVQSYLRDPLLARPEPPSLNWRFDCGPAVLRNVEIARDLYYRPTRLDDINQYRENGRPLSGLGFGTDLLNPGRIEADQFVMFGDNSAASRDGRIWGRPHPLAANFAGDDSPFVVPRRLLIGKAFSVYFPAPLPWIEGGRKIIPDFGRTRFIR